MIKNDTQIAEAEAIKYVKDNIPDLTSIIVGGSIVRNEGDKNSDLDIYVIHKRSFRRREKKRFNGVSCDIFINNLTHIEQYFEDEYKKNRPVTAHILSTGKVVFGNDKPEIKTLIEKSQTLAETAYPLPKELEQLKEFELCTLMEDVDDVLNKDIFTAQYLMENILIKSIDLAYLKIKKPLSRIKNRLKDLEIYYPEVYTSIKKYYSSNILEEKCNCCKKIVQSLNTIDFTEWVSEETT